MKTIFKVANLYILKKNVKIVKAFEITNPKNFYQKYININQINRLKIYMKSGICLMMMNWNPIIIESKAMR